jgi:hypothetical protein
VDSRYFFTISVGIAAPPDYVWTILRNIDNWHTWTSSIRKIRRLGTRSFVVGAKVLIFQPKLPPALWRVTALDPGRGFTWISTGPGIFVTAQHVIDPTPEGSKVTLSIKYDGPLAPLVVRLIGTLTDRYLGLEAAGLKKQSESTSGIR